jgi:phosphatidylglycerol:prolipoprotein diacylglycerol transferase
VRQVLFTIPILGGLKVFGYGTMLVLAFIGSTWIAWWRSKREGLDREVIVDMAFWLFLSGMIGARLFYCVEYWGKDIKTIWDAVQYWKGGVVYYGGIVGGTIAFFVYRHFRPFPLRPFLDVVAPGIAVGTLFGRLGCFLNGCCYGDVCDFPWAISFPKYSPSWGHQVALGLIPSNAVQSLPVHPTQLYSAVDALIILILLNAYYPLRRRDGEVMGLLMVTYPITRFFIEYLRSDEPAFFGGLTIAQNISLVLFFCGLAYWLWLFRLPTSSQESPKSQARARMAVSPQSSR